MFEIQADRRLILALAILGPALNRGFAWRNYEGHLVRYRATTIRLYAKRRDEPRTLSAACRETFVSMSGRSTAYARRSHHLLSTQQQTEAKDLSLPSNVPR